MIIDIHSHIYDEKEYKEYLKKIGSEISKIIIMQWFQDDIGKSLEFVEGKNNFFLAGTVNMEKNIPGQLATLEKLLQGKKIVGIKLYPGYQYFYPSDRKVFEIAKLCQKYAKPLIFHSGDVYNPEGDALLKYSHPLYIDELAVKFQGCKIIISHFGFPYLLEAANVASKNKNVYTDISGTIDATVTRQDGKNRIEQYAEDLTRVFNYFPNLKNKVMFGTDFSGNDTPLNLVRPYIEVAKKVFSKKQQEDVFHKLAEKIFFT